MTYREFSERLNRELDDMGLPQRSDERVEAFAKLVKIPRFKAEALLSGNLCPDAPLLAILAEELEVNAEWLLGKSDRREN